MVFDYMEHDMAGLLTRTVADHKTFITAQVKRYMQQLFFGLSLLQKNNILHRDLKNANLLVNNLGDLKIADFGLARNIISSNKAAEGLGNMEADGVRSNDAEKNVTLTNRVITLWYR